jgi:hypothetical protein
LIRFLGARFNKTRKGITTGRVHPLSEKQFRRDPIGKQFPLPGKD